MVLETSSPDIQFEGIYDAPEAARFVAATLCERLPFNIYSTKVIRWIRRGLAEPKLGDIPGRELLLSFEDLISVRIITALRSAGVSFPKIYRAEQWLRTITKKRR
ncbi:hypothetical protein ACFLTJ_04330, partial [Chloroflexota bacterium]